MWSKVIGKGLRSGSWSFTPLSQKDLSRKILLMLQTQSSPVWRAPNGTRSFLKEKQVDRHNLSVQLMSVSQDYRGNYTCSLEFGLRTLISTVQLEVLEGE